MLALALGLAGYLLGKSSTGPLVAGDVNMPLSSPDIEPSVDFNVNPPDVDWKTVAVLVVGGGAAIWWLTK